MNEEYIANISLLHWIKSEDMRRIIICFFIALSLLGHSQQWQPASPKLNTPWTSKVDPNNTLSEYPRPQMVRDSYTNLNGLWDYAILPKSIESIPAQWQGKILVPFAVESALSGVGKKVGKDSLLWYKRIVNIKPVKGKKILLHFAADWESAIYINGIKVGLNRGGFTAFEIDITSALTTKGQQEIAISVWDPTDDGPQPRGKQVKNPRGIWYTPVTGIWQTVWIEQVPDTYINTITQTPDIDKKTITVSSWIRNFQPGDQLSVSVWDNGNKIGEQSSNNLDSISITVPVADPKLWWPENPFLYDIHYQLIRKGKVIDSVKSYFAMRKISMQPDDAGIQRMMLNNKFVFQYGPLDQGWWPDGLYTAPTDEALRYDIEQTKAMGFNMIRKHVKVEPARWYYHCDKLGMLVWQDMPSGDLGNKWESRPGIYGKATDKNRTYDSEWMYRTEWYNIIRDLYNFPSIVVWVPFNEAWGQFKTEDITEQTMKKDPSRLVNPASGGNFVQVGHIFDLHNYPEPLMPQADLFGKKQILVLGEFGGLGLPIENHTWQDKNNWGYQSFKTKDSLYNRYAELVNTIPHFIQLGLSAAVYTQTTDVEVEINGLMTYDRQIIKMPVDKLRALHQKLYSVK